MAQRYIQEATSQLAPVYDQQSQAISAQIPAIQQLYETLMGGLQSSYNTQLTSGVQQINEDASARGVLRSTLPNDSRAMLTTQLGQALMEGRGQLAAKQAGEVAGVNEKLGTLGIQKAGAIADLARSLEDQDLDRQKFEWQKNMDQQQLTIEQQKLAISRQTAAQNAIQKGAPPKLVGDLYTNMNAKKGKDGFVAPETYAAHRNYWVKAGGLPSEFDETYGNFVNPVHQQRFGGYY